MRFVNTAYGTDRAKGVAGVLALAAALVLALAPMPAGAASDTGDGGTQSVFSIGAGSRAIGLGRSFVSIADDASSVYWNPATLRNVQRGQLMFMYMPLFGDFTGADYVYFGAAYPTLNAGAFGLAFQRVGTTFDSYDAFSRPLGESDYSDSQLLVSYAFQRRSKWLLGTMAVGASFKVVHQQVDPFTSTAPGADLGLRWIPGDSKSFAVGLNFQDVFGAEQKLDAATDVTYSTVLLGAGYTHAFSNGSALRLLLQMDLPEKADTRYHAGAEYMFSRYLALRAGYDEGNITFGVGFDVSAFGLDYAYLARGDDPGSSNSFTFTVDVGKSLDERRQEIAEREAEQLQALIREQFESRVRTHRTWAAQYESEGDYAAALDEWQAVLAYIPDDSVATAEAARTRELLVAQQAAATESAANQAVIRTRFSQGLTFYENKDYVRARAEWQAILDIDSTHAGALEYLDKTQAAIDQEVSGHITRARRFERTGRYTEAIGEWNNVQLYEPDNTEAAAAIKRLRSRIESVSQDFESAQRRLRIVNLYNESLQLYNRGEYQRAVTNLDEVLRLQPDHEDAKRLRALANRKLTPLTADEKARIRKLYLSGMQFFAKDEYSSAIAEWQKILEIDPTNESVQRNIEEARQRLRKLENR
jgi:tetratricopeptide (TPR) repeat protein